MPFLLGQCLTSTVVSPFIRATTRRSYLWQVITLNNIKRAGPYVKKNMNFPNAHKNKLYLLGLRVHPQVANAKWWWYHAITSPTGVGVKKEHSKIHLGVNASACTTDRVTLAVLFPTHRAFRKIKTRVSLALLLTKDTFTTRSHRLSRVILGWF